eukprot:CAMPEP_0194676740 /NCGR_PEP_ID=MMETSP0295-20121207/9066_1 /TAXON_ID=39354 /ORGANISM="Heterosigma akashiwo, Strain CCMP2393" /LENGTH=205 /DNA_ID=CAMNT_0039561389 /DNA_START=98 /DNA_END=711 /DNA_ORIENTATION=+
MESSDDERERAVARVAALKEVIEKHQSKLTSYSSIRKAMEDVMGGEADLSISNDWIKATLKEVIRLNADSADTNQQEGNDTTDPNKKSDDEIPISKLKSGMMTRSRSQTPTHTENQTLNQGNSKGAQRRNASIVRIRVPRSVLQQVRQARLENSVQTLEEGRPDGGTDTSDGSPALVPSSAESAGAQSAQIAHKRPRVRPVAARR